MGSKRLPITGTSEDPKAKIARIERTLRQTLSQAPVGGKIDFEIGNLPEGFTLTINNPASWSEPKTFCVNDATNVLKVSISDVCAGDVLSLNSAQEAAPGYKIDRDFRIPNAEEAARINHVACALEGKPERDLRFALALMGPWSTCAELVGLTKTDDIEKALAGAKAGTVIARMHAQGKVLPLLQKGNAAFREGFEAGLSYKGPERFSNEEAGLKCVVRGQSRRVVRGGYNMLRPERSGPLHPATVTQPSTFELKVPGRNQIRFQHGGSTTRW